MSALRVQHIAEEEEARHMEPRVEEEEHHNGLEAGRASDDRMVMVLAEERRSVEAGVVVGRMAAGEEEDIGPAEAVAGNTRPAGEVQEDIVREEEDIDLAEEDTGHSLAVEAAVLLKIC